MKFIIFIINCVLAVALTIPLKSSCPNGGTPDFYNSSMCLFYVSDPKSSDAADSYCNSKYQGDTIAIPNAFENKAISEYLKQQISDSNQLVWLGAYADNWSCCFGAEHGIKWFWYDYNIDFGYTNFASTENGDAIIGYGVAINPSTGYWYMKNTTIQLPFLCKAPMKH